jgi:uncharacterized protein
MPSGSRSGAGLRDAFDTAARDPARPYIDCITVDDDLHLILPPRRPVGYGNHSCDPNLWWTGPYTQVARRDIAPGEEITTDYAASSGIAEFRMSCACKSPLCRTVVTGSDWKRADLQQRYGDHWVPGLLKLIKAAQLSLAARQHAEPQSAQATGPLGRRYLDCAADADRPKLDDGQVRGLVAAGPAAARRCRPIPWLPHGAGNSAGEHGGACRLDRYSVRDDEVNGAENERRVDDCPAALQQCLAQV